MTSRSYQPPSEPTPDNSDDTINFSHALPRRLSAEQLLDTQHQVIGVPAKFSGYPAGLRAAQLPGGSPVRRNEVKLGGSEKFLAMFGKPARLLACECERSSETTLGQTFQLISSPYPLSPRRGWSASPPNPRLTPWATFGRCSAAQEPWPAQPISHPLLITPPQEPLPLFSVLPGRSDGASVQLGT